MLKRNKSLKNSHTISYILRKGSFLKSKFFNIRYIYKITEFKYVIIISKKKYRKAVDRNKLKRKIKHILYKNNIDKKAIQTIILPKCNINNLNFNIIERDLVNAFSLIDTPITE